MTNSQKTESYFRSCGPLNFEATTIPPWRNRLAGSSDKYNKTVQEMLSEIIQYKKNWEDYRNGVYYDSKRVEEVINEMKIKFVYHINIGEEEGTQTENETRDVLDSCDNLNGCSLLKPEKVTANICRALTHLNGVARQAVQDENYSEKQLCGLLDLEDAIMGTHHLLLDGLDNSKAGQFSTNERFAKYKGETHNYPHFKTEQEAEDKVQGLVDVYNSIIDNIKNCEDERERMYSLFKCASWFFFQMVSLHPFGDGNGRLCRLLCNYILRVETPFPVSIYNINSESTKQDYFDAIVSARKSADQHPRDLAAMMIECSWLSWKKFI